MQLIEENADGSLCIEDLWFTQRSLKRVEQIPRMIACLQSSEPDGLPPVELHRCDDGQVVIHNGHHRVTAIWLSGRRYLRRDEFHLYEMDSPKRRIAKVERFISIAAPHLLKH